VQFWDPGHPQNPGATHERDTETDVLPNTRALYAMSGARNCRIPGVLVLQNLETAKKVTINTGEEDSEILVIHEGTVL
jgi:hypothetical protein